MKKTLYFLLISALILSAVNCGFKVSGVEYDLQSQSSHQPQISDGGNTMRLQGDTRVALTQGGKYAGMDFIGKTLSFDVNLSGVGCGCNLAMYMSQLSIMPVGQYCDANQVGGHWCPEMDIMEGNTHSTHTTPHCCCDGGNCNGTNGDSCIADKRGSYGNCDKWGYGGGFGGNNAPQTRYDQSYGPGRYIDTNKQFNYAASWDNDGMLNIVLSQDGKKASMYFTNSNYLSKFKAAMTDMTIIISLWAGDMTWLDGGEGGCGAGGCNLDGASATISNMQLTSGGSSGGGGHHGGGGSGSWEWGQTCAHNNDGLCGDSCSDCAYSWPQGSSWNDPNANCRCKTSGGSSGGNTGSWEWGQACAQNNDGQCGNNCNSCVYSWPQGSNWSDPNAACRCKSSTSFIKSQLYK